MSNQKMLFACSKCFSRHPFENLSTGEQICKDCRGTFPVVKCNYCRSEFPQASKSSTASVCRKCEQNVKQYGKPNSCECCNIIAAFIGSKCQRCANSELKYGPPIQCEQCKQRSAFDRRDDSKKIDGKLLCWLCTSAYKRALAKAREVGKDGTARLVRKRASNTEKSSKENTSRKQHRSDGSSKQQTSSSDDKHSRHQSSKDPIALISAGMGGGGVVVIDPNSSEHVVAMTQLREQIVSLQKRLSQKDKELMEKDKLITELKGKNFTAENELRNKMKDTERLYEMKIDLLNKKVNSLLKELAVMKKNNKAVGGSKNKLTAGITAARKESPRERERETIIDTKDSDSKDSGGSGTDSPI